MAISEFPDAIFALVNQRRHLTEDDARDAMRLILQGQATEAQIAAFLVALHLKGETVDEITGCARALREAAGVQESTEPLLDTCGTGGDGAGTFNISTIAAFVVAGAGVRVAKHGNRSLSSRCGSADLLEALGIDLHYASTTLPTAGIAFYFAPLFHGATRHVQPVRAQLKIRSVFNYLGPLTNPAGANIQIAGAFSEAAARLIAGALARLGLRRGFVVHGTDGLDEVTTTAGTIAFEICEGRVTKSLLLPQDFGLPLSAPAELAGGEIADHVRIAESVLSGSRGAQRDVVLANAALALNAAGSARTLPEAVAQAAESIDSGRAHAKITALRNNKAC